MKLTLRNDSDSTGFCCQLQKQSFIDVNSPKNKIYTCLISLLIAIMLGNLFFQNVVIHWLEFSVDSTTGWKVIIAFAQPSSYRSSDYQANFQNSWNHSITYSDNAARFSPFVILYTMAQNYKARLLLSAIISLTQSCHENTVCLLKIQILASLADLSCCWCDGMIYDHRLPWIYLYSYILYIIIWLFFYILILFNNKINIININKIMYRTISDYNNYSDIVKLVNSLNSSQNI